MTVSQIIHVDSTYRNRLMYPNPADFVVNYGSPTGNTLFTMTNPVTRELPVYNFVFPKVSPYNFSIDFIGNSVSPIPNSSLKIRIASWNSRQVILNKQDVDAIFGSLSSETEHDFLRGLYFVYGSVYPYTVIRIISYDSLTYTITLNDSVTINLSVLNYCYLYNDSVVTPTSISILLTGSLNTFKNYVRTRDLYILNATRKQQAFVTLSDDRLYLTSNDSTFTNWTVNDFYILFNNEPKIATLLPFPNTKYYSFSVESLSLLESSESFPVNYTYNLYQTDTSTISSISIRITRVDGYGKIMTFELVNRGYDVLRGRTYYIDDMNPEGKPIYALFRVNETYQSFLLSGNVRLSMNEFFTPIVFTPIYNNLQQVTWNVLPITYGTYESLQGTSYTQLQNNTGSSMIYSTETWGNNTLVFTTAYDETTLSLLDAVYLNGWWDMVLFSSVLKDQYVPLNYTGSTVSQEQMSCYEIELLNLILPNLELNTTKVLTSFYPYLFVELSNMSSLSRNINVLYTNNLYGQSALFAVPISDVNSPEISQFLNLNNCKSIQTVKFKPNDSLHFRVFLTNGQTFTPYLKDTLPPIYPNPLVQISAVFSIRKL